MRRVRLRERTNERASKRDETSCARARLCECMYACMCEKESRDVHESETEK